MDLLREQVEQASIEAQKVEERLTEGWTVQLADAVASALAQAEIEHTAVLTALQTQQHENLTEQLQARYEQGAEETAAKYLEKIKELEEGYQVALMGAEQQKRADAEALEGMEQVQPRVLTHPINTVRHLTIWTQPINTPCRHSLLTHSINSPHQPANPFNP